VPVSAGVGASIDFLSGHMRRAPVWMRRSGLEWAFRLLQEPRRLFSRYAKDFRVFGWRLLAQYLRLRPRGNRAAAPEFDVVIEDVGRLRRIAWPARLDAASVLRAPACVTDVIAGGRDCVVDLSAVESLDSAGLGFLIGLRRAVRSGGREIVLLAPSAAVLRALELMRLDDVLPIAPDIAAARQLIEERRSLRLQPVSDRVFPDGAIAWRGELTAETCDAFWSATRGHAETQARTGGTLAIDLTDLRFVDSAGLILMQHAKAAALGLGTAIDFRKPSPVVRRIARLAGVERSLFEPGDGPRRAPARPSADMIR
jgi:N-acetylglucosaminyldiphosphoundecaprenol N-acetyl-beta-D-mannosaminyltransferase